MNLSAKSLFVILLFLLLTSCQKKEDLGTFIPKEASNIACLNLPQLKSKLLDWKTIKKYLFSKEGEEQFPIDLNRKVFLYNTNWKDLNILIPISSADECKSYLEKKLKVKFKNSDGIFSVAQYDLHKKTINIFLHSDFLFFSNQAIAPEISQVENKLLQKLDEKNDFDAIFNSPWNNNKDSRMSINFNDGELELNGSFNGTKKDLAGGFFDSKSGSSFCFKTDSCILGLSANLNPEFANKILVPIMPYLSEYHILNPEHYRQIQNHITGNIYLGISKIKTNRGLYPLAKIGFELLPEGKRLVHEITSKLNESQRDNFWQTSDSSFFIHPKDNYVLFCNNLEMSNQAEVKKTFFNLEIDKNAINEKIFTLPKILYGTEVVESFPFSNFLINAQEQNNMVQLYTKMMCNDKNKNSFACFLEWINVVLEQSEI